MNDSIPNQIKEKLKDTKSRLLHLEDINNIDLAIAVINDLQKKLLTSKRKAIANYRAGERNALKNIKR